MQGRGRGSYLGLLLESGIGKSMVGSINEKNNMQNDRRETTSTSPVPVKKPLSPTWTSLDLLGNRGRRTWQGREQAFHLQEGSQENKDNKSNFQDAEKSSVSSDYPGTTGQESFAHDESGLHEQHKLPDPPDLKEESFSSPDVLQQQSAISENAVPKTKPLPLSIESLLQLQSELHGHSTTNVHLFSPEEFLPPSSDMKKESDAELDSSSETCESNTSGPTAYVPPHRRKGFEEKPEVYSESAVSYKQKPETRKLNKEESGLVPGTNDPQKVVESELNWQKWKLQRNFKKLLNNLSSDSVLGLGKDIKDLMAASQLSTKFPGVSDLGVVLEVLVGRVLDDKETVDVAMEVCRVMNAISPDEFPPNLREVLIQYRNDTFAGVANKNSRCDRFCLFLKKFCEIAKVETKSFQDCVKESVIGCLHEWISPFQSVDQCSQESEIKVSYLCDLLEFTKNALATGKKSWIKSCFGKIKNCILSEKVSRDIRESLLDAVIRQSLQPSAVKEAEVPKMPAENDQSQSDLYKDVKKMLSELELEKLLEKFHENLIRDSLLRADKNELKNTLQEAGFAPGAILEIQLYLEKIGISSHVDDPNNLTNCQSIQRRQTCGLSLDSDTRVNNLESDLKQLIGVLESDREKEKEIKNEKEKTASNSAGSTQLQTMDLKKSQVELKDLQASLSKVTLATTTSSTCRPPPGFSMPVVQNRRSPSAPANEGLLPLTEKRSHMEHSPVPKEQNPRHEVFLREKNPDSMGYQHETNFGSEAVNWPLPGANNRRGNNERGLSRHKGRGRGRRDTSGSLEASGNRHSPTRHDFGRVSEKSRLNYNPTSIALDDSSGGVGPPSTNNGVDLGNCRPSPFGASMPVGCFICGAKDHRSAYCKNNAAMFD